MKRKVAEVFNLIFGFRKTLAWFSILIVAVVFRILNYIDGSQMVDLIKTTFAGFLTGNVAEHVISFGKGYIASKIQVADTDESNDDQEVTPVVEG